MVFQLLMNEREAWEQQYHRKGGMWRGSSPLHFEVSRAASIGAEYVLADATGLPFREKCFDVVNCSHVLEHLDEEGRKIASREVLRVLRCGGRLELQAFSVRDMRCGVGEEVEMCTFRRGDGIQYHYFQDDEVKALFALMEMVRLEHRTLMKRYHGQGMVRDVVQAEFVKR
ncbi:MAG: hypothetical protein A4E32_01467 [Methanomassiliicoccales archaeon PtaU1.Bin124]|nr:MAG: hypothetical protein A4E32_01467 [Methanomassiliicoccales archaeon PtaU1.Bin124]